MGGVRGKFSGHSGLDGQSYRSGSARKSDTTGVIAPRCISGLGGMKVRSLNMNRVTAWTIWLALMTITFSMPLTAWGQPPALQEVLPPPQTLERMEGLPEERPIGGIGTDISPKGDLLPRAIGTVAVRPSGVICGDAPLLWAETVYFWDAPAFCYRPLYYEEINLERHGYTHCRLIQPALSAAHFATATAFLPYQMTVHKPLECIYPLGHYRAGSPVPFRYHRPELRADAALVQAGTVLGLIFIIP
jgi:hypothetical protein